VVRLETNAAIFLNAVTDVWDRCRARPESAEGSVPVICFATRRQVHIRAIHKAFWAPVIEVVGWYPRNKVPSWASCVPTVKLPGKAGSQVRQALLDNLQHVEPTRARSEADPGAKRDSTNGEVTDSTDGEMPDDPIGF
jgi:hypothetical protein